MDENSSFFTFHEQKATLTKNRYFLFPQQNKHLRTKQLISLNFSHATKKHTHNKGRERAFDPCML